MTRDDTDPVLTLLAGLRAPRATDAFEQRIRQRCHAAIARRTRTRSAVAKPFSQRVADAALVAMAGGYAALALIQATQVAARVLGFH
ncbi:MAG TPA: hypothetical protein VL693_13335 [Vicinamibacterales bacterium]|jgi:hypothetical protein|nr:hypothetical protein [Vicinamibacterales bacterium]